MIFGVWPGVVQADLVDFTPLDCPPEDPHQGEQALIGLHGAAGPFYIRCYRHFGSGAITHARAVQTPGDPARYTGNGRLIDLVACYQSPDPDPDGFAEFVREAVRDVARWGGGKVQVGEEPNAPTPLDGGSPGVLQAIAAGVSAALDERDRHPADVGVGVNVAGLADPAFWTEFANAIGPAVARLDYIGLDMFPDVFRPVPEAKLAGACGYLIERLRTVTTDVGVPEHTPFHITETGWPTGDGRHEDTQARILQTVAHAVISTGQVTVYEFFGLRDGRTDGNWRTGFGLLRDDYTPKPAYEAVRRLIQTHRPVLTGAPHPLLADPGQSRDRTAYNSGKKVRSRARRRN